MVFPVLCFECGNDIGSFYRFFKATKMHFYSDIIKNTPVRINKINSNPDLLPSVDFILKALGLNLICCRKIMISYIEIEDLADEMNDVPYPLADN